MVTTLSVLTRLEKLAINFTSLKSRPARKTRYSPPTRTIVPVLTNLMFTGVSEYLEDLLARIDAPLLDRLNITFYHKLIFDTPQLTQFIGRTPNFKAFHEAHVGFYDLSASIKLYPTSGAGFLVLNISSKQPDWQLLTLARLCRSSFLQALIPVERLYIRVLRPLPLPWQDERNQWLELLDLFTAVKDLYITSKSMPRIAPALQELIGERVTEVLPSLQVLLLPETIPSEPAPAAIGMFVAARQLTGHPISISRWDDEGR